MTDSLVKQIEKEAIPAVASGVIGAVASNMILGVDYSQKVPLFGMSMPAYAVVGGVIGGSYLVAELNKEMVLEKIPMLKNYANLETRILGPVIAGVGTYAVFRFGVSENTNLINSVGLGVGSSIAGKYLSETIMNK